MTRRRIPRWLWVTLCVPCASLCMPWNGSSAESGAGRSGLSLPGVSAAWADDQGVPLKAQARSLFEEAKKLATQQRWAEACPKFQESQRLDAGIGTKFYLADCLEHIGRYASAWVLYLEVADEAGDAKMAEREDYARKRAEALQPKLTRMVLVLGDDVKGIKGIEVRRDGVVVQAAQWGTPVPVDAGRHTIAVGAPGKRSWETTVEASGEGATVTVTIPTLKDDASAEPAGSGSAAASGAASGGATAAPTATAPADGGGMSTARKAAIGLGAAGVVGLIIGAVGGGLAADKAGAAGKLCTPGTGGGPATCTPEGGRLREDANTLANVANVGIIGGAVLAAAGVVIFLVAPGTSTPSPSGARAVKVGVTAGPQSASVTFRKEW